MASLFDSLPPEMLQEILEHLEIHDIATFLRCNKSLQYRVEPVLYKRARSCSEGYSEAIRWACNNGVDATVRKVASFCGPLEQHRACDSPIHEAVTTCQPETIRLLLDMGARIHDEEVASRLDEVTARHTLRKILVEGHHGSMKAIVESNVVVDFYGQKLVDFLLIGLAKERKLSLDIVLYLLGRGADPYRAQLTMDDGGACPVATATVQEDVHLMDLFLARGASIHGKPPSDEGMKVSQLPIFVAARHMLMVGVRMVSKCLERGALANHGVPNLLGLYSRGWYVALERKRERRHPCPTPIHVYLKSCGGWSYPYSILRPVDGLRFWLENGVILDQGVPVQEDVVSHKYQSVDSNSLLYILIDGWGFHTLEHDAFYEVVLLLAKYGVPREEAVELGSVFDQISESQSALVIKRWEEVLGLLHESMLG